VIPHLFLSRISQSVSPADSGMTDRSYQASGEGQICLDLHLFVPSLVLRGSNYLSLLSDPSKLISMTEKSQLLNEIGQCTIIT
jgi:hypothetical protein